MERKHKKVSTWLFWIVFVATFFLSWNFKTIASDSISFISIALAIYTVSIGALIGSNFSEKLRDTVHPERKDLTQLDVISNYMKYGIIIAMITILLSLFVQLDHSFILGLIHRILKRDILWKILYNIVKQLLMSACFSFLSLNFLFVWYVFTFIINRQVDNR